MTKHKGLWFETRQGVANKINHVLLPFLVFGTFVVSLIPSDMQQQILNICVAHTNERN